MKGISAMVEELNEACKGALSITHYLQWDLHSYEQCPLFFEVHIRADTFKELIEKAYQRLQDSKKSVKLDSEGMA